MGGGGWAGDGGKWGCVCGGGRHKVLILWEEICVGKTGSQTVRHERWDGTKRNSGDDYSGVAEWQRHRAHRWRWRERGNYAAVHGPQTHHTCACSIDQCQRGEASRYKASTLSLVLLEAEWWLPHPTSPSNITATASIVQREFLNVSLRFFGKHLQAAGECMK